MSERAHDIHLGAELRLFVAFWWKQFVLECVAGMNHMCILCGASETFRSRLSVQMPTCLSLCLVSVCPDICVWVCLSVCLNLPVCLSKCLSVFRCMCVQMFVCLSFSFVCLSLGVHFCVGVVRVAVCVGCCFWRHPPLGQEVPEGAPFTLDLHLFECLIAHEICPTWTFCFVSCKHSGWGIGAVTQSEALLSSCVVSDCRKSGAASYIVC